MKLHVNVRDPRWNDYKIDWNRAVRNALTLENKGSEVSITLTGDSELRRLNRRYRGMDKPTDVLSFESGDGELLGDIFISFDAAMRESKAAVSASAVPASSFVIRAFSFVIPAKAGIRSEFMNRAAHLAIHGTLHLQGFDHKSDADAEIMESRESEIMQSLGLPDPYAAAQKTRRPILSFFYPLIFSCIGALGALGFAPWHVWPLAAASIGAAYWLMIRLQPSSLDRRGASASVVIPASREAPPPPVIPGGRAASDRGSCKPRGMKIGRSSLFFWGAGYAVGNFHWCLESIFANDALARTLWPLYPLGLAGIALAGGVLFGLPFWMTRKTGRGGAGRTVYFALAWTFILWLREWLLTGFPWNPLSNIALNFAPISNLMSIFGAIGLTFVLAGAIGSVPEYFAARSKWQFLFFAPLVISPIFNFQFSIFNSGGPAVRIVQPAFDMNDKFDRAKAEENIRTLVDLSLGAPAERGDLHAGIAGDMAGRPEYPASKTGPDLIIWPETAFPYAISGGVRMPALGSRLVAGAIYADGGKIYNSMILTDKKGNIVDKYFKTHLVPFGEYRPFGDIIPTPGRLDPGTGSRIMGDDITGPFAPAICYEVVFSDSLVPRSPLPVPHYILNITNDAWFGQSFGPYQHLDMARRQAIETGLPVVRANYGGISAIIDANGRVVASLPLGVRGTLDGDVPPARETLYRRLGLHRAMLLIVLLCAALLFAKRRRK